MVYHKTRESDTLHSAHVGYPFCFVMAFVCDVINRESGYIDENGRFFNAENPLSISTDDSDVYPFDDFDDKD